MVSNYPLKFLLILLLATLACGLPTASTPAPIVDSVPTIESTPTVLPALMIEQIKNAQYPLLVPEDGRVVQLTDGVYQSNTDTLAVDYAYAMVMQFFALGDVTGDGLGDAAVMFVENYGGTGQFVVLAIYANVAGEPLFITSTFIDDRPMLNSISIENGEIFIDAIVHSFEDPGCCPALPTTRKYALVNNQLRLVHYTSNTPENKKREIVITSLIDNAEITMGSSVQLTGSVSIAPFENSLSYFVYDEAGVQLLAGAVNVTSPDFGAPGTFNQTIDLSSLPTGVFYLEIEDQSAADGAVLALESVKIFVK
ncbi:MAG: hypothetical protein UZ14_CFX002002768 [Chloroflexi bacterium OLB14]|nr:MAG: hypothetical protein UZ14_CFX002002768 [Chloroflexi bacterium OLB14]